MKIHLGKTATSRTRKKKVVEAVSKTGGVPQNDFTNFLFKKGYSYTTVASFYNDVKKFKAWVQKEDMELESVMYNDITAYLQSLGSITQHTKGCYLRGIRHYFTYLIQKGERSDNPVEFIQLKGIKRKTLYDLLNRQELDRLYHQYTLPNENSKDKTQNWFRSQVLAHQRNKVILGLMLFQALDTKDLKNLTINDVKLREGKLYVPGTRRSNERELKLEALQIMDLMEYLLGTRKEILQLAGKQSEQLFVSVGSSDRLANVMVYLIKRLHQLNSKVTSVKQLKASVIVHWLKLYNLREVQYKAGHRYVSSTEAFLINEMEGMIEDIERYHPII